MSQLKVCVAFQLFWFWKELRHLKSKSMCFLLNKNINFNKSEMESKMENPPPPFPRTLREKNLATIHIRIGECKVKLWSVGACEREKSAFFITFILCEGHFFNISLLSQCIVYWINLQKIHTSTYQKTLLHTLFYLFLKSSKAFSASLAETYVFNFTYYWS